MKATAKKAICILISGAALGMAAPAFADRGHDHWDEARHHVPHDSRRRIERPDPFE